MRVVPPPKPLVHIALLSAIGLWGCAAPLASLDVPPARLGSAEAVAAEINRAGAAGDCDRVSGFFDGDQAEVRTCCQSVVPVAVKPLTFFYDPLYPTKDGFVADGNLVSEETRNGGGAGCGLKLLFHSGRFANGDVAIGRLPQAELVSEKARVTLAPETGKLRVDVTVTVRPGQANIVPFALSVDPEKKDGVYVTRVMYGSAPYPFKQLPGALLVPARGKELTLRIQYEGVFGHRGIDYFDANELILRDEASWLPTLPQARAQFDVTVELPATFAVFGQGTEVAPDRFRLERASGFTLYGGTHYVTRREQLASVRLTLAIYREDQARVGELQAAVQTILAAYRPFGPYPFPELRIVESGLGKGQAGYGALSNVTIGSQQLAQGLTRELLAFLAHELAHGWFGGRVAPAPATVGQWSEAVAEYASSLPLGEQERAELKADWQAEVSALRPGEQRPVLEAAETSNWKVNKALRYAKGALILTGLEQRCGRAGVLAALHRFLDDNANKLATWNDITAAVRQGCGADPATWFAEALRH